MLVIFIEKLVQVSNENFEVSFPDLMVSDKISLRYSSSMMIICSRTYFPSYHCFCKVCVCVCGEGGGGVVRQ